MRGAVPEAAILDMLAWPHSGFSLNAEVRVEAHDRTALGREPRGGRTGPDAGALEGKSGE